MILLLINFVLSQNCEDKLESILRTDLIPRIESFKTKGVGLDYFCEFPECYSTNSTYVSIFWKINNFLPCASYGFCLPKECAKEDYNQKLSFLSSNLELPGQFDSTNMSFSYIDYSENIPMNESAYFFISCFVTLLVLEMIGTFYTYFSNNEGFLSQFSIIKNFKRLFYEYNPNNSLNAFDGIRALMSITVIWFHCYYINMYMGISDRFEFNKVFKSLYFTFVINLSHSVDVFFILSGFLMSYLTIREIQSTPERFSWARVFCRRIIRLLPILYFIVGIERIVSTEKIQFGQIGMFHVIISQFESPWWMVLTLSHNLFPVSKALYLIWTWTVSIDFQFYLLSSLTLYLYTKHKSSAYLLSLIFLISSLIYTYYLSFTHNLSLTPFDILLNYPQLNLIYIKPIPRFPAFIIGTILGFIFNKSTQKKSQISIAYKFKDSISERFEEICLNLVHNEKARLGFYALGFIFVLFSLFANHYLVVYGRDAVDLELKSVWVAGHRLVFSLGFSFLVFPVIFGFNRGLAWLLELRVLNFLAKISYAMYLVHPFVFAQLFMMGSKIRKVEEMRFSNDFVVLLVVNVLVSTLVHVVVESPFLNLAKKYLGR